MTKWMKKNRDSFPDDYLFFRLFLFLNYCGVIIGLIGVVFMMLFLTGVFLNISNLILWLGLFLGGLGIAMIGNRMQLPFLQKYLFTYIKDQSISVDFDVNEWIYHQKYLSIKAYKYGLIASLIAYLPLIILFSLTLSLLLNVIVAFLIAYLLLGLIFLTNLPFLYVNSNSFYYSNFNEPLILLYGIITSFSLVVISKNPISWIFMVIIPGLYWLIFLGIWKKIITTAENDVQESLLSDIFNYLSTEKEIVLTYWKWIQSRRYLIADLIQSGRMSDFELIENKIIKKK
jgi:hypothetical protein